MSHKTRVTRLLFKTLGTQFHQLNRMTKTNDVVRLTMNKQYWLFNLSNMFFIFENLFFEKTKKSYFIFGNIFYR